jgi:hypothetical protein
VHAPAAAVPFSGRAGGRLGTAPAAAL